MVVERLHSLSCYAMSCKQVSICTAVFASISRSPPRLQRLSPTTCLTVSVDPESRSGSLQDSGSLGSTVLVFTCTLTLPEDESIVPRA